MIALCADEATAGPTIEIGYDDDGGGAAPPIVFVHGLPHNRSLWAPQVHALAGHARCIAPDLRGFGQTPATPPFSIDRYADDVAALLRSLGVERAVIAGISMGGHVALAFWRRHRERTRALLLAGTRPGTDDDAGRARRREIIALAREEGSAAVADRMIVGMVGKSTRERSPALVESVRGMLASATVEGVVGAQEAMLARPDPTPTLARIDVPTLVVTGDEDVIVPPAAARAMHAAIRGSRLEVIAGAGHLSNFERPAAFNHVAGEFLSALAHD
ncbi:MAG: alpha/beta fold hydrolase [Gemmatimonadaceae bacterium]